LSGRQNCLPSKLVDGEFIRIGALIMRYLPEFSFCSFCRL
jgi:hypothetical protein